jgi:hypothetical protein
MIHEHPLEYERMFGVTLPQHHDPHAAAPESDTKAAS